jgi:undecaprenyl-diphosphatase
LVIIGVLGFVAVFLATQLLLDAWSITEARHLPRWFIDLSGRVSAYGKSGWILWPMAGLLLVSMIAGRRAAMLSDRLIFASASLRLTFLLAAIALPGLLTAILKPLIGRARPYLTGQPDAFSYAPFAYFREAFGGTMPFPEYVFGSMPSGHATTAVAIAVSFTALWPRLWPFVWSFAIVICASRLTIAVHHPTDVLVGALIGGFGALAIRNYFAARRWVFAVDVNGCVQAMPGPAPRRLLRAVARLWSGS